MSLVFFNCEASTDATIQKIKEKTGVDFSINSSTPTSSNYTYEISIKFPDMGAAKELTLYILSSSIFNDSSVIVFIDVENHFFMLVDSDSTRINVREYLNYWIHALIFNSNENELVSAFTENYGYNMYDCLNIPSNPKNDISRNDLVLYPAYLTLSPSKKFGYLKNVYLNCERSFAIGLKFIDQNGNKFVTLGSYLLYKVD